MRILKEYPSRVLSSDQLFYRLRVNPDIETDFAQYDSPPETVAVQGRLNADGVPIMYGSQDLEVCIHECRVLVSDELYVATLTPTRDLRVLDLTKVLEEEHVTEFESLDIAIYFLFAAGEHSYEIARDIAVAAKDAGFDGVLYPSYFTNVRLGMPPNQTSYGISHRRFPQAKDFIESTTIPNIALFGRPIAEGKVEVECINRLLLRRIQYDAHFGPVGY